MYDTKSYWFFNQCLRLISANRFSNLVVMSYDVAFHQTRFMKTRDIIGRNKFLMHFFWHIKPISMKHPFEWPSTFNHKKNLVLDDVLPNRLALPGTRNLTTQEYITVLLRLSKHVKTTCFQLKALQLWNIESLEIYLQKKLTYRVT